MNARAETPEDLKARLYRWVLIAGALVCLAANLPGHMSPDSVLAYEQAREKLHATWEPAAWPAVLHLFDRLLRGPSLYVTASVALLFGAWLALPSLTGRRSWPAVVLAALLVLTPQMLIYPGVVWADVALAELSVMGFILLARAARDWPARRDWLSLAAAAACLALASAVRENGLVIGLAGGLVLAATARRGGWRPMLIWGAAGMAVIALLATGFTAAGHRYAKTLDPDWQAHALAAAPDQMGRGTQTLASLLLTPDLACQTVATGISGPADLMDALELAPGKTTKDRALSAYARHFYGTPAYSHLAWALVGLALAVLLLLRRRPGDGAMAGLQLASLAFAASLSLTAASCHYRNLYVVDLSAMTGLIYLALDLRWPKRRSP
jgi:hypothetical protein